MLQDWDRLLELAHLSVRALGTMDDAELERLWGTGALLSPGQVHLLAPIARPSKIVAVGMNYRDHCLEQGGKPPERPVLFAKFPSALMGPNSVIRWDPAVTSQVDYEAELAVIIGRRAFRVSEAEALEYVAGYTALNDVSARDLQFGDRQWVRGKSLDSFCPIGPALVTTDEIPFPGNLSIECLVNGEVRQSSCTSELMFGVPQLLAFITRGITLLPGDIIATGTPAGVGVFRKPPVFLRPGDDVIVRIEGIGDLVNHVGDPLA
jgi:2-keto-4-pentenoate hydratase/2-oxohepta-3-ene-1,7-dioic acid hydratase in catechol pathway